MDVSKRSVLLIYFVKSHRSHSCHFRWSDLTKFAGIPSTFLSNFTTFDGIPVVFAGEECLEFFVVAISIYFANIKLIAFKQILREHFYSFGFMEPGDQINLWWQIKVADKGVAKELWICNWQIFQFCFAENGLSNGRCWGKRDFVFHCWLAFKGRRAFGFLPFVILNNWWRCWCVRLLQINSS